MYRNRHANPKMKSDFICLNCLQLSVKGLQRYKRQREKFHIKDLFCHHCLKTTKQIEVRYCDYFPEVVEEANQLHIKYYGGDENGVYTNEQLINA